MDIILRPWIEYFSMEIGTYSWCYSMGPMGKNPPNEGTIPMDLCPFHGYSRYLWEVNAVATAPSTLSTSSLNPPAAATLMGIC